jgi:hypothetical protein
LDKSFKIQLEERANFVIKLQDEIKEKEREFQEYCRQVEIDRKDISLKSSYTLIILMIKFYIFR